MWCLIRVWSNCEIFTLSGRGEPRVSRFFISLHLESNPFMNIKNHHVSAFMMITTENTENNLIFLGSSRLWIYVVISMSAIAAPEVLTDLWMLWCVLLCKIPVQLERNGMPTTLDRYAMAVLYSILISLQIQNAAVRCSGIAGLRSIVLLRISFIPYVSVLLKILFHFWTCATYHYSLKWFVEWVQIFVLPFDHTPSQGKAQVGIIIYIYCWKKVSRILLPSFTAVALLLGSLVQTVRVSAQQLRISDIIIAFSGSGQAQLGIEFQSLHAAIKRRAEIESEGNDEEDLDSNNWLPLSQIENDFRFWIK